MGSDAAPTADGSAEATPRRGLAGRLRGRWVRWGAVAAGLIAGAVLLVVGARWLCTLPAVERFLGRYDGYVALPPGHEEGIPLWVVSAHAINMFLFFLILQTGLGLRRERVPEAYFRPRAGGVFAPPGTRPHKVSLRQVIHQALTAAWILNGAVFIVATVVGDHWHRIVPRSWEIVPQMASVLLQYLSLDWPQDDAWTNYNALQVMSYFVVVFVLAPLALLTGWRLSTWWPQRWSGLTRVFSLRAARRMHVVVMISFVAFVVVHVTLVALTGLRENLNAMFTAREATDWWGVVVVGVVVVLIVVAARALRPAVVARLAERFGEVSAR